MPTTVTFKTLGGKTVTVTVPSRSPGRRAPQTANGYAAKPGTGPAGENCKSCVHAVKRWYWWKCALLKAPWPHSCRTDIRLKSPACRHWQASGAEELKV
jgi:hypothetical protein